MNRTHAQHTQERPRIDHRWGALVPWLISVATHGALIGVGFFVVWTALPAPVGDQRATLVSFASPSRQSPAPTPDASPSKPEATPARPQDPKPRIATDAPSVAEALASPALSTDASQIPRMAVDAPALSDIAAPSSVRFFGVGTSNVRSVVYVVDASGSMITTFPFILDELERSAGALDPLQRFQVIFFKGEAAGQSGRIAAPDPAHPDRTKETRLIRCTPENVRSVLEWTRTVRPGGRSNPIEALRVAIGLRPDAILMLSSSFGGTGQWEVSTDEVLAELDALNPVSQRTGRRPISIMTVQMIEEDPSGLLRAIGERHGPSETGYRFIARSELHR